jgi:hypothetical protein
MEFLSIGTLFAQTNFLLSSKTMHSRDKERIVRRELKENDRCILQFYSAQKTKHLLENKSIVILLGQQCAFLHIADNNMTMLSFSNKCFVF